MQIKLVSWNINGLRAGLKKGLLENIDKLQSDILCFQEIKIDDQAILEVFKKEKRLLWQKLDAENHFPKNLDENTLNFDKEENNLYLSAKKILNKSLKSDTPKFLINSSKSDLKIKNSDKTYLISLEKKDLSLLKVSDNSLNPTNYNFYWHSCSLKKGYSGLSNLINQDSLTSKKIIFKNSLTKFGIKKFDDEGRLLVTQFEVFRESQNYKISLINAYFPQGGRGQYRINYKLEFYLEIFKLAKKLKSEGQKIIITGDLNTTVKDQDLARPKQNQKTTGCLPEERLALSWLLDKKVFENLSETQFYQASPEIYNQLLNEIQKDSLNLVDSFRYFEPETKDKYTYWDQITRARDRNVGWRIDYFLLDKDLLKFLKKAEIHSDIFGSDHCPISVTLEF